MQILISNRAKENLEFIFEYISFDSIQYANKTLKNIYSRIYQLEKFPYLGRYVPEISNKQFRELLYKNYRIVYDVSKETDTVYIHFIVHSKRDFKSFYNSYRKF